MSSPTPLRTKQSPSQLLKSDVVSISSLSEFEEIVKSYFEYSIGKKQAIFRGEKALYTTLFTPLIFRNGSVPNGKMYPNKIITDEEIIEVEHFQKWASASGNLSDVNLINKITQMSNDNIDWLPLAQHHRFMTRFLDVTYNPFVALFFACGDTASNGDGIEEANGYLYYMTSGNFRPLDKYNTDAEYPDVPDMYVDLYDVEPNRESDVAYLHTLYIDSKRINVQEGALIFHKEQGSLYEHVNDLPFQIEVKYKKQILTELDNKMGINDNYLFP